MVQIFIDGSSGTTGLRIRERLEGRKDLRLLTIPEEQRKDPAARSDAMAAADVSFLCLPDDAAREAAAFPGAENTVIIDTSTAHRTHPDWTYGFPEITGQRDKIILSRKIANPGCHASGFIALAAPLTELGVLKRDAHLNCFSLTGYSGGGKKMIAQYESASDPLLNAPRMYGLTQRHKHLPEMAKLCGLYYDPIFCPIVSDYYAGMEVVIPLFGNEISIGIPELKDLYREYYSRGGLIRFREEDDGDGMFSAAALAGTDRMEISVFGERDRILLVSRFDNLGKGASGAAIQNMNLVLGIDEKQGLVI